MHPQIITPNPQPSTLNPKPSTLNPKPQPQPMKLMEGSKKKLESDWHGGSSDDGDDAGAFGKGNLKIPHDFYFGIVIHEPFMMYLRVWF